jgi:TonB-linked SusC/RagA family outer membrane protein
MQPTSREIEEVVVEVNTGFFTVPKERSTGSYVHIDGELLNRSVGSNILDRLDGVTKGAIFNTADMGKTRLRNQASIGIRGISTINGNAEPLIILDNFPYEGDIDDINPDDIESVTVLQDAAAASIWGARAGNGVIVLTSKMGKAGQPMRIQWRNDASISAKPDLYYTPTIPMGEWIGIEKFQFDNNLWNGVINQRYTYITPVVDILLSHREGKMNDTERDAALARLAGQDVREDLSRYVYRNSSLLRSALSLQGGQERMRYYLSTGIDRNNGQLHRQGSTRYTVNSRNTFELWKDRLSMDASVSLTDIRSSSGGNVYYPTLYSRLADDDGNHLSVGGGRLYRQRYIDTVGEGLLLDWNMRPLDEIGLTTVSSAATAYQLQTGMDFKIAKGLTFTGAYRYMSRVDNAEIYTDPGSFDVRSNINLFSRIDYSTGAVTSAVPDGGTFRETSYRKASHHARGQLSYDRQWGIHRISALGGMEINQLKGRDAYSALWLGYDPDTESYTPVDYTALYRIITTGGNSRIGGSPTNPYRLHTVDRSRLYFGNAAYHFDQRYGATFSIRKDEANIFGAEANMRGKPFWSLGGLWHIHNEKFFSLSFLDKLSLRVTTGAMGNVSTASAYITSTVASGTNIHSGEIYQTISTPPNPSLSWEKVQMSNFGLDFGFFGNRLSGSIEHYRKQSTGLLSSAPIHPSSGVSTLYGNWSSLSARGWDLTVQSKNLQGKLSWRTDMLLSSAADEITQYKLKPSNDRDYMTSTLGLGYYPIEGRPLYSLFSFESAGLDAMGDPQGYVDGMLSKDYVAIYTQTPLADFVYHGRATPSMFGSLRNTFAYGGIELSFNIFYKLGYHFRREALSSSVIYSRANYNTAIFQPDYTYRWQQTGDELHTDVPRLQFPLDNNRESFYQFSETLVEKGDHIRLRDIRLSHAVEPRHFMKGVRRIEAYFFATNLGILWRANRYGIDPDTVPGLSLSFPTPSSYSLGVTLNF